jgi:hypothetical protein
MVDGTLARLPPAFVRKPVLLLSEALRVPFTGAATDRSVDRQEGRNCRPPQRHYGPKSCGCPDESGGASPPPECNYVVTSRAAKISRSRLVYVGHKARRQQHRNFQVETVEEAAYQNSAFLSAMD